MIIRNYTEKDWETVLSWWIDANEPAPIREMLPTESTFVLEVDNKPMASITVYLTNCKEVAYLENLGKDQSYKNKQGIDKLIYYAQDFAKEKGFKRVLCLSYRDKLKKRYQDWGFINTLNDLSSFVKELV